LKAKHYKNNCERYKERGFVYRAKNKDKIRLLRRNYYENNSVAINNYKREYCKRNSKSLSEYYLRYKQANMEKIRAKYDVHNAIRSGILKKATNCICCRITNPTKEYVYHHFSYKVENRLNVMPLCKKCHARIHSCINKLNEIGYNIML
jgi:hypothetical protein